MIRAVILSAAIIAGTAYAARSEPLVVIGSHPLHNEQTATHARLHAPTQPHAAATLTYRNRGTNSAADNGEYRVEWQGIVVLIRYRWNAAGSADRIDVLPPPGYIARPDRLELPEETRGEVQIIKWEGM